MRRIIGMLVLIAMQVPALPASAQGVEAARTIRPGHVIEAADLRASDASAPGAVSAAEDAIGQTARRMIIAGRPVMASDIGPPALVQRNAHVSLVFERGSLSIRAEGRALSDGAEGELVRVMNLASRQTVTGTVLPDGSVATGDGR